MSEINKSQCCSPIKIPTKVPKMHSGFVSLLYSISSNPLSMWSKFVSMDGKVQRVEDRSIGGDKVIEIIGPAAASVPTNITCPACFTDTLNVKLPVLVFIVKNLGSDFSIELQVLDKQNFRRRFTLSTWNAGEVPKIRNAHSVRLLFKLDTGWNILELDLQNLCHNIFRTDYRSLQRVIVYPNCRLRRIYLVDRHYDEDETSIELCQAFFDMYWLKWGINMVERSCQTDVKFDNGRIVFSSASKNVPKMLRVTKKFRNEDKSKSLSIAGFQSLIPPHERKNDPVPTDIERATSQNGVGVNYCGISFNTKKDKSCKKFLSGIKNSQFLKFDINSTIENMSEHRNGKIFDEWPYTSGHWVSSLEKNKKKTENELARMKKKEAATRTVKQILEEVRQVREDLSNSTTAGLHKLSLYQEFDLFKDRYEIQAVIPPFVEKAASTSNDESNTQILTTDHMLKKFLDLRHITNTKMLSRLQNKGYSLTEVELSIFNLKHRRNNFGQGKLIESNKLSVDKAVDTIIKSKFLSCNSLYFDSILL